MGQDHTAGTVGKSVHRDFHSVMMHCFTWINTWIKRTALRSVAMAALHFRLVRSRVKKRCSMIINAIMRQECESSGSRVQESRRSEQGRCLLTYIPCVYSLGPCGGQRIRAETAKTEGGAAHPYDTARSYWLHRQTTLVFCLLKLLKELGKQMPNV